MKPFDSSGDVVDSGSHEPDLDWTHPSSPGDDNWGTVPDIDPNNVLSEMQLSLCVGIDCQRILSRDLSPFCKKKIFLPIHVKYYVHSKFGAFNLNCTILRFFCTILPH